MHDMTTTYSPFVFAIYFPMPGVMDSPFSNPGYLGAYRVFTPYALERGVDVRIVRGDSYQGEMNFSGGWYFDQSGELRECGPLTANLILNKSGLQKSFDSGARVLNHPDIERVCSDKRTTFAHFSSFMPQTIQVDKDNAASIFDQIRTDKVVFKPVDGAAGRGIHVLERGDIVPAEIIRSETDYLAQEFIDTSKGIPGVTEGMHDLRLFMFNGVARIAYVRKPKQGSYLANIALGGSMTPIDVDSIPAAIKKMASDIDAEFREHAPRFYSADFMYGEGERPYLVELNSHPGFPSITYATPEYRATYFDSLLEIIR